MLAHIRGPRSISSSWPAAAVAVALILMGAACDPAAAPAGPGDNPTDEVIPVQRVVVSPANGNLTVGAQLQLSATLHAADGRVLDRPVRWESADPTFASVTQGGLVTATGVGEVEISAVAEGRRAYATLRVRERAVASVVTDVEVLELHPDDVRALNAVALDENGARLEGRAILWYSPRPDVVEVSDDGRVRAVGPGDATVIASVDGVAAEVKVSVRAVPVAVVEFSQPLLVLEPGEWATLDVRVLDARGAPVTADRFQFTSANTRIAEFIGTGRIASRDVGETTITLEVDGKTATMQVRVDRAPSNALIFDRVSDSGNEIFIRSVNGQLQRMNAGNVSSHPSPSPDGSRFVFAVTQRDMLTGNLQHDLYVVDRSGLNIRHLTRMAGVETDPAWSPDGQRIAFAGSSEGYGANDVYVMNVDGTGAVNLTGGSPFTYDMDPTWSPDGQRIAYTSMSLFGWSSVYVMNADGTNKVQVTSATLGNATHPTWSPDGQKIAFVQSHNGSSDVCVLTIATGHVHCLEVGGHQQTPAWSPDGRHIAYAQVLNDGLSRIFTMRDDGSAVRLRTAGRNPAWIR